MILLERVCGSHSCSFSTKKYDLLLKACKESYKRGNIIYYVFLGVANYKKNSLVTITFFTWNLLYLCYNQSLNTIFSQHFVLELFNIDRQYVRATAVNIYIFLPISKRLCCTFSIIQNFKEKIFVIIYRLYRDEVETQTQHLR